MKFCLRCKVEKPLSMFHKRSKSSDGHGSYCKSCRSDIDRESYESDESRRDLIKQRRDKVRAYNCDLLYRYKKFCGCQLCSENTPVALDLHHLDPEAKEFSPSLGVSMSTATFKKEIRKCVVLCANCHRKLHAGLVEL